MPCLHVFLNVQNWFRLETSICVSLSNLQKWLFLQISAWASPSRSLCRTHPFRLSWVCLPGASVIACTSVYQVFPTLFDDNLCISLLHWKVRSEDRNFSCLIHLHIRCPSDGSWHRVGDQWICIWVLGLFWKYCFTKVFSLAKSFFLSSYKIFNR